VIKTEEKVKESPNELFTSITLENWKTRTVKEFFCNDPSVFEFIRTSLPHVMKKTTEDVEQLAMGDFDEEFEQLAFMNGIDPKGYELVRKKIDSTLTQLQDQMEKQEA